MDKYIIKIIKTGERADSKRTFSYRLIKDEKIIAEGTATSENIFRQYIDRYDPRIEFVENFNDNDNE